MAQRAPRYFILPNGNRCGLRCYLDSWRQLRATAPHAEVRGWSWHPVKAGQILAEIRAGIHDRINTRGGLVVREASPARIQRRRAERVRVGCKWCGQVLDQYAPDHSRFCSPDCRHSYYS